ncbi:unnamed protein product [Cylindrotheca closterium]|uniref:Uncharacterized protein n=1 Tax=Cylindrotheca closterium TaxID=2856 RepID=A0AAD2CUC1_9STRA|nr:unnamed protein product [Cylindrotheca closterium]
MKDAGEDEERKGSIDAMAREDTNPVLTQVSPGGQFTPVASQNPLPTTNSRLQRPLTVEEKLPRLTQVNLVGIPGKCHIFETTFVFDYQGSESGTVAERILSTVLHSLEEAINNSPHELRILPISDSTYKPQNLLIRSSADIRNKLPNYWALSVYCDMDYGNCAYAATNSKPGEKKLRTRLRGGFASDVSTEAVQDYLHIGL